MFCFGSTAEAILEFYLLFHGPDDTAMGGEVKRL